ncbi:hypothetical protein NFI96_005030 [Prochilodus magdalenae]|nr:hypothetical protein NFI96_005030 [Prochilodus magdalenae]
MWQGIQVITDYKSKVSTPVTTDAALPAELNNFYTRFETSAQAQSSNTALSHIMDEEPPLIQAADESLPSTNDDEGPYREEVKLLTEWCAANNISLNVSKTKELIIDFRKGERTHTPLNIGGTLVERAQQRLHFLRRLRRVNLPQQLLCNFYRSTVESILTSCITVWCGSATSAERKALQRVVKTAEHITATTLPSIQDIYHKRCLRRAVNISSDPTHPSQPLFQPPPSGKRRWLMPPQSHKKCGGVDPVSRMTGASSAGGVRSGFSHTERVCCPVQFVVQMNTQILLYPPYCFLCPDLKAALFSFRRAFRSEFCTRRSRSLLSNISIMNDGDSESAFTQTERKTSPLALSGMEFSVGHTNGRPDVGRVLEICLVDGYMFFIVEMFTAGFLDHLRCYQPTKKDPAVTVVVDPDQLNDYIPLVAYPVDGKLLRTVHGGEMQTGKRKSNHISLLMKPTYWQLLKRVRATARTVRVWPEGAGAVLQDCFQCTDWEMFRSAATTDSLVNINEYATSVTGFIRKCVDDVTQTKQIRTLPNQKLWMNIDVRSLLKACDATFKSGKSEEL